MVAAFLMVAILLPFTLPFLLAQALPTPPLPTSTGGAGERVNLRASTGTIQTRAQKGYVQLLTAPSYGTATPRTVHGYPFVATAGAGPGAGPGAGAGPGSGENYWKFGTTKFALQTGTALPETDSIPQLAPPYSLSKTWAPSEPKGVTVTIGPATKTGNNNGNQLAAKVSYTPQPISMS